MDALIDLFVHFDKHLKEFVDLYGVWVYAALFVIIFAETGFVVTPFLPGDSLLFAAGALAATGAFNIWVLLPLLIVAAVLGEAVNYAVGDTVGPRVFTSVDRTSWWQRLLNRDHLTKAHAFFEKYGGKAIVLGRFVPIVRTFVPFVAGAAQMSSASFVFYNLTGGIVWVLACVGAGLLFGNVPIVKENFSLVTIGIVLVSVLPVVFEMLAQRRRR